LLPFILWAIARGSIAVAGEIERGTLDLVMSRPVSRFDYLAVQVSSFLVGMLILLTLLVGGNLVGSSVFPTTPPTTLAQLLKASANLAALTWTIYGLTLMCSCYDLVRWRPNLIAASFTLVSSVTAALAQIRSLKEFKPYLENTSIFSAYDPLDAVKEAEYLGNSLVILGGLGTLFVALAFVLFLHRDLPSNS
jgi:ABC-2 type transport system permease protein